jgi:hypothetical protein
LNQPPIALTDNNDQVRGQPFLHALKSSPLIESFLDTFACHPLRVGVSGIDCGGRIDNDQDSFGAKDISGKSRFLFCRSYRGAKDDGKDDEQLARGMVVSPGYGGSLHLKQEPG